MLLLGDDRFQWHVLGMFAPSFFTGSLIGIVFRRRIVQWHRRAIVECDGIPLAGFGIARSGVARLECQ